MNPLLLVVTPTLGRSLYLSDTVAAVSALPAPLIHVLVCPGDLREDIAALYPNCIVLSEAPSNRSMYGAINTALRCEGVPAWSHFTYINDDDLLYPASSYWGEALASTKVFYGQVEIIDSKGNGVGYIPTSPSSRFNGRLWENWKVPYTQQGMVVPRSVIKDFGLFDDALRYAADMEYWIRLEAALVSFQYHNTLVAAFRIMPGQLSGQRGAFDREIAEIRDKYGFPKCSVFKKAFWTLYLCLVNPRSYWMHFTKFGFRPRTAMFAGDSKG